MSKFVTNYRQMPPPLTEWSCASTDISRPHSERRLSDLIKAAFDRAYENRDYEVAQHLVEILDILTGRTFQGARGIEKRKIVTNVEVHEKLWNLKNG